MPRVFYNVEQAARKLGLSVRQVEALISSKELQVLAVGNRRVIPANDVDRLNKKGPAHSKTASLSRKVHSSKASRASLGDRGKEYYTDVEVAQKLNKPYTEIYRMANLGQLPVKFVDDRRVFPKQAIDHLAAKKAPLGKTARSKPPESHTSEDEYFTPKQVAHAFQRTQEDVARMIRWGDIKATTIDGRRWISREELERIIPKRQKARQQEIWSRLPVPCRLRTDHSQNPSEPKEYTSPETVRKSAPRDTREEATEKQDLVEVPEHMVMEAAKRIGTSINKVKRMIETGELVLDRDGKRLARGSSGKEVSEAEESLPDRRPMTATTRTEELEKAIQARELENQVLAEELEREKTWHAKDLQDSQHEIGQLDIQLENLRREKERVAEDLNLRVEDFALEVESLRSELEQERERRADAEYSAGNLQRLLEEERESPRRSERKEDNKGPTQEASEPRNAVHGFLKGFEKNVRNALNREAVDGVPEQRLKELEAELKALKVTVRTDREYWEGELKREQEGRKQDKQAVQYAHAQLENSRRAFEEQSTTLAKKLEEERFARVEIERRVQELESKLNRNETERKGLEKALALEKQRIRPLESDARMLAQIRRLLGVEAAPPLQRAETTARADAPEGKPDETTSGELVFQTRYGRWVFRPPFALEEYEIELIRLVAGEDEITAERVRSRTGRRRATSDLDELLDRLHAAGAEPIQQDNDRYRFDPDFVQD